MAALPALGAWTDFYMIVGPAAATLTGLQFVVVALVRDGMTNASPLGASVFTTPTVVHFAMVLLIAAVMAAPWASVTSVAIALAVCGIGGVAYALRLMLRMRKMIREEGYTPVAVDWLWHAVAPLVAYVVIGGAGVVMRRAMGGGLFAVAGATLVLLLIGVHNAWDVATYIALEQRKRVGGDGERGGGGSIQ